MKKRSKLPVIVLAVALLAVSLGGGMAIGKGLQSMGRIDFMPYFYIFQLRQTKRDVKRLLCIFAQICSRTMSWAI